EDDQRTTVAVLRDVMDRGRAGEAVHDAEADAELFEYRSEHAAHGALLTHYQHTLRLVLPEVATIGVAHGTDEGRRVGPAGAYFELPRLVDNPFPRNVASLARYPEQAIHALHLRLFHGGNQGGGEKLVADAPAGNRLCGLSCGIHCLDQIERLLRHAATALFDCFKLLGAVVVPLNFAHGCLSPRLMVRDRSDRLSLCCAQAVDAILNFEPLL